MNIDILEKIIKGYSNKKPHCLYNSTIVIVQKFKHNSHTYYLLINKENKLLNITINNNVYRTHQKYFLIDKPISKIIQEDKMYSIIEDNNKLKEKETIQYFSHQVNTNNYFTKSFLNYLEHLPKINLKNNYLFNYNINFLLKEKINIKNTSKSVIFSSPSFSNKLELKDCLYLNGYIYTDNLFYVSSKIQNFYSSFKNKQK